VPVALCGGVGGAVVKSVVFGVAIVVDDGDVAAGVVFEEDPHDVSPRTIPTAVAATSIFRIRKDNRPTVEPCPQSALLSAAPMARG
jgi:hypothetical protein